MWRCHITTRRIESHAQGYGEPPVSQSLQAKDRDRQSSDSPSWILLPTYDKRERERDVRVLDPKGLVGKYLGTQDLDTHKCTQFIMRVSKMQILIQKWSLWVTLKSMLWNINSRKERVWLLGKMARSSQGNNMRRTNKSITRTKSWTNKKISRSMSMNSS
jgi:hypothetical protein